MRIFFGRIDNTRVRPDETGIIEGIVQAPIVTNCARDHELHVGRLGYICANAGSLAAIASDRSNGLFTFCDIDICDHHARALSRKSDRGCAPDAGGTPGHHDYFSLHET
jgi:hypothetical protein